MKLILSTGSIKGRDVIRAFQIATEASLNGIEILLGHSRRHMAAEEIHQAKQKYGLEISFVHAPFFYPVLPVYLMHPQKVARSLIHAAFEIASETGARGVIVHPFPAFFRANHFRKLMATVLKSQRHFKKIAAVENMERRRLGPLYFSPYCLRSGDDLYEFVCEHNYHITLDVAHCTSHGIEPGDFYKCFRDRIVNIHLSDYEAFRCHYPIGTGTIDFEEFVSCLHEYNYDGYLCLETNTKYEDRILESVKKLKEWIG